MAQPIGKSSDNKINEIKQSISCVSNVLKYRRIMLLEIGQISVSFDFIFIIYPFLNCVIFLNLIKLLIPDKLS